MHIRIVGRGLALLACVLLFVSLSLGQERFGELNGSVTDQTGAVLPGVSVTVTNKTTERAYTTTTGADGAYVVRQLEPGPYSARFEMQGFTTYTVSDLNLLAGQVLKVNAPMQVGGTEQHIEVTEAAPLIDVTRTAISHDVTAEEIDRLPKGRSFQQLALVAPSVNTGEIEGGFQINGASGAENQFIVDGISTTSLINGKSRQDAMFEILQQVQVKTGGIDAEYGGALGGVVSAVTKSGGNDFHGDIHYYYTGSAISAGPVKRLLLDPGDEKTVTYQQDYNNPNHANELGFTLGGPIIKNKLFFFAAASPRWQDRENVYNFTDGTDTLKQDRTYHMAFGKINFDPTQRVRTNFSWLWTPTTSVGRLLAYDYYGNGSTQSVGSAAWNKTQGFFAPQSSYTGQVDITMTDTSLLTLRGGRFWDNFKDTGVPGVSPVEWGASSENMAGLPDALRRAQGYQITPRVDNTFYDLTTRTYAQVDVSKFGSFFGQHNIKGGWGISKTVNKVDVSYHGGGYITLFFDQGYKSPFVATAQRGTYGYYRVDDIGTRGTTGGTMHNLYIQDQWRVIPRLTLTLGLRTENEVVPSFRRDLADYAIKFGFGDKIAPRLGASLDVFGDGRLKLYTSWGRYFDWVKYELARGTFGGDFWTRKYRTLDTLDVESLSASGFPGRDIWNPNVPNSIRNLRTPSFGDTGVDPDLKPMSSDLINAGAEFQFGPRTVFRANYVHNNLRRTMEDIGVLIDGDEHYIQANPGEGRATMMLGTCSEAGQTDCTPDFAMPKARRTYDAMELTLTRRFGSGFFGSASYVLSRLYGNYAGLSNSDEISTPTTGVSSATAQQQGGSIARPGSNTTRTWDLAEYLFDSRGNVDVKGRLATDRPHVFKLYGSKELSWNAGNASDIGVFFYAGSGTPLTTNVFTSNSIGVFVNGRGDMGRTPWLTQTDLMIGHEFRMGETKRIRFEFNALNLFNQKTARNRFFGLNRGAGSDEENSAIDLNHINLFNGYDYRALLSQTEDELSGRGAYDPRYGLSDLFNPGFQGRFGVKFIF